MRANRADATGPEVLLRQALRRNRLRGYRVNQRGVVGRPDVVFVGAKLAVFVHGCFWHRCPHCNLSVPKTNAAFWRRKFELNAERDARKRRDLELAGWGVIEFWEHEVRSQPNRCALAVARAVARAREME
jgi:DNA mismatch endonuclease (patch repair protein)